VGGWRYCALLYEEIQNLVNDSLVLDPGFTTSAAMDQIINSNQITNEDGVTDSPWYWSGTPHIRQDGSGTSAVCLCFSRAMGYRNNGWLDVHGASTQRIDRKDGDFIVYNYVTDGYYFGSSPQGDAPLTNQAIDINTHDGLSLNI
jgi:hypothetical protein